MRWLLRRCWWRCIVGRGWRDLIRPSLLIRNRGCRGCGFLLGRFQAARGDLRVLGVDLYGDEVSLHLLAGDGRRAAAHEGVIDGFAFRGVLLQEVTEQPHGFLRWMRLP